MDKNGLGILLQHVLGPYSIWRMSSYIVGHLDSWFVPQMNPQHLTVWSNKQQY